MVIGIDMGHTLNPANYGAKGIKNESEETRKVGEKLIQYLECMGNKVVNVTQDYSETASESLRKRVELANAQPLDLFVSLHFNFFDGERNGSEIYTYGGKRLPAAVRVLDNLGKLGFKKNGIFDGSKLYVLRKTKAPAMLIEIAYVDSEKDMSMYNPESVAKAIAEGITNKKVPENCLSPRSSGDYKVLIADSLSYESAKDLTLRLKSEGYIVSMEVSE